MFEFRIIDIENGSQVIDKSLRTPYESLTPLRMLEYTEMECQLEIMDLMERKARREEEQQQKMSRNLLYKLIRLFGLV